MLWGGGVDIASIVRCEPMELPMQTLNDLSRSLIALEPASTLIAVIEMSLSSWLVAGIVPGIERQPLNGERRPTVSTPSCSNVLFSAGCAASVITARWSRSPH